MFSIEFTLTQLDAAAPVSDIGILSIQGGADVIAVPTGTNNLQISDGVNTSVIANVLTHLVPSVVRVVFTANTMQIGVDGVAVATQTYDGTLGTGNIELVRDGGFAVKDISIYDEALPAYWAGAVHDYVDRAGILLFRSDLVGVTSLYGGDSVEVVNGTITTMQVAVDLDDIVIPAFRQDGKINFNGSVFFNNIVPMGE